MKDNPSGEVEHVEDRARGSSASVASMSTTGCGVDGSLAPPNTALVTSHSQVINGLAPNTGYQFRMRSRDAAGNLGVSGNYRFKTRPH